MYTRFRTAAGVYTASSRRARTVVHAVVGGGVQFQYIQNGAVFNAQAGGHWLQGLPSTGA